MTTTEGVRFDDNTIAILAERSKIAEHTIETVLSEYNVLALEVSAAARAADADTLAQRIGRSKNPNGLWAGDLVRFRTGRAIWLVEHSTHEGLPTTLRMVVNDAGLEPPVVKPRVKSVSRADGVYYLNNLTRITGATKGKNQ